MRDLRTVDASPLAIPPPVALKRDFERHIVGVHVEKQSDFSAVWLSHDTGKKGTSRVTVRDSFVYPRGTHLAAIADDLKRRGQWIPIASRLADQDYIEALRERGCSTLTFSRTESPYDENPSICAVNALEIDERLTTGTFLVRDTNVAWLREYESFGLQDGLVPQEGFGLMRATLHAYHYLHRARSWPEPRRPISYSSKGIV
jgi:hypothetical protein